MLFREKISDETPVDEAPADEAPIVELPADEALADEMGAYRAWLDATIFDFLAIADLPTSNERHVALVALKLGEKLAAKFKLIEAFILVESAFAESEKSESLLEMIAACRAKVAILKKQLGI